MATGFDSEYYRDDPRAREYGHSGIDASTSVANTMNEPLTEPSQTMADPVKEAEHHDEKTEVETQSADFAEPSTVNMWDNIRTDNSSDDSDIPAILRRRKKNKD